HNSSSPMNTPLADPPPLWVICLCAEWCGLCRDYADVFRSVAARHPSMRFAWVDIEDQAELAGELDIDTFPTLLVSDTRGVLFQGELAPHAEMLSRLLQALALPDAAGRPHNATTSALTRALPGLPALWVMP
ncbi:MAG: hypothetical protein JWQ72_3079, partial [Polaromonas sp.]|nr:hypothetical protein [Polaromonas sp.]